MDNTPFFIVGNPRSGTTLLRFILASHPRIYISGETGFIPFLVDNEIINEPLAPEQIKRVLDRIAKLNRFWEDSKNYYPELLSLNHEIYLSTVLDYLYKKKTEGFGAERWGDKTPYYVRYIPVILRIFPEVKFIHMIRDVRDTIISAKTKWDINQYPYMDNYYLLQNWIKNVRAGREALSYFDNSKYMEVRYEDLVSSPVEIVRKICSFLGEDFWPKMLDQAQLAQKVTGGRSTHSGILKPITPSRIYHWKTDMDIFSRKIVDKFAGELLSDLNYERETLPDLKITERIHLWFLQVKYLLTSFTRDSLYELGLLSLNRRKREKLIRK